MAKFICVEPVTFNHEAYAPGDLIELPPKDAGPLLAVGAVKEPAADKSKSDQKK